MGLRAEGPLLLDACVLINLYASQHILQILEAIPSRATIVELVRHESLYVMKRSSDLEPPEKEPIDLTQCLDAGVIQYVRQSDVSTAELESFVDLARSLDDGEAMTASIALSRGWAIATDDKAAIKLLDRRVNVQSTLEIVQTWSVISGASAEQVGQVLRNIADLGSYRPARGHPLMSWWNESITR